MGAQLDGRVALVTGAARNIGREIALGLAASGADVFVTARRAGEELNDVVQSIRGAGRRSAGMAADAGRADDVKGLAASVLAEFGRVDILVNNAAIRPSQPFLEITDEEWQRVIDIDLNAAYYLSKAVLPGMVERRWGRIVNITGRSAMAGGKERAHVSTAKHGLHGLTKALAREFGPHGVTVNAVSPGPIGTAIAGGKRDAVERTTALAEVPMRRFGTPAEIASICVYLASEEAAFLSGQMIGVNGASAT